MQTPPKRRPPSLFGYTFFAVLIMYMAYGVLQTIPLFSGMLTLLKEPILYLVRAVNAGLPAERMTELWAWTLEKIILSEPFMLYALYSEGMLIAVVILYCRLIEKLPISTLGFTRKKAIPDYLVGMLAGTLMLALAVFVCERAGALTVSVREDVNVALVVMFFFAFLLQGMAEEVLFRGYMFRRLCLGYPLWLAALVNSLLFAFMHLGNQGMTFLSFLNLLLFGIFASLLVYRCDGSIWCVGALHSLWNFAQGNLFGISVSGNPIMSSVFSVTLAQGRDITHGGIFGLEGGAAVTLVLLLATAVLWMLPQRNAPKKGSKN